MAIGKTEDQVTEIVVGDDRWAHIDAFFQPGGAKKLMWYYQEGVAKWAKGKILALSRILQRFF